MVKCPLCQNTKTKLLKEWSYGTTKVWRYECGKCLKSFNFYKSSRDKTWKIPKDVMS